MYNIKSGEALVADWGITEEAFNLGGWGNLMGDFKVYRSLAGIYKRPMTPDDEGWDPTYGTTPPGATQAIPIPNVLDREKLVVEIAIPYIEALYATFETLRVLGFRGLFPGVQDKLRLAVLAAIQLALINRNVLERVTSLSRSGGSIQITQADSSEVVPIDLFGLRANSLIVNSGIMGYDIIDTREEAQMLSENGNLIIGKFDETKIKDLI